MRRELFISICYAHVFAHSSPLCSIRPWIDGFVESHGPEKARDLLEGAGLSRGARGNNKNWTIMTLDEILSVNETIGNDSARAFDNFVREFHSKKNASIRNAM